MKNAVLLLFTGAVLSAATITTPVLFPDGVTIGPSANLGAQVYAVPNSVWQIWFNDDYPNYFDGDTNDVVAEATFGQNVVTISYLYSVTATPNNLVWGGTGWLTLGQSSSFATTTDGGEFPVYMQLGGHNNVQFVSGTDRAWVSQTFSESTVAEAPEPGTVFLMLGGALVLIGAKRKKLARARD